MRSPSHEVVRRDRTGQTQPDPLVHRLGEPLERVLELARRVVLDEERDVEQVVDTAACPCDVRRATCGRTTSRISVGVLGTLALQRVRDTSSPSRTRSGCSVPPGRSRVRRRSSAIVRVRLRRPRRAPGPRRRSARRMNCVVPVETLEQIDEVLVRRLPGGRRPRCPGRRAPTRTAPAPRAASASASTTLAVRHQVGTPPGRTVERRPRRPPRRSLRARRTRTARVVETREASGTPGVRRHHAVDVVADVLRRASAGRQASSLWRRRETTSWPVGARRRRHRRCPPVIAFLTPLIAPLVFFEAPLSCRSPTASVRSLPPCS